MVSQMSFYEERILPHIIDKACSMGQVMKLRSQVVPQARGRVLEVGMGSGINLEYLFSTVAVNHYGAGTKAPLPPPVPTSATATSWYCQTFT